MANKRFSVKILAKSVYGVIKAEFNDNEPTVVGVFLIILAVIIGFATTFGFMFSLIFGVTYIVPYFADYFDYILGYSNEFNCTKDHSLAKTYELFHSKSGAIKEGCHYGGVYLILFILFITMTPFITYVIYQLYHSITRKYNEEMTAHSA